MKVSLILCGALLFSFTSYAAVPRKELISYTLDYYASGGKIEEVDQDAEARVQKQEQDKTIETQAEERNAAEGKEIKKEGAVGIEGEEIKKEGKWSNRVKVFLKNVHPYAKVKAQYDDNVYLIRSDEVEDFVTTIDAGLLLQSKLSKNKIQVFLDGGEEITRYASQTKNNISHPYARGLMNWNLGKVGLAFTGGVDKNHTPASLAEDIEEKVFITNWVYNYGSSFKFNLRRFESELQYNHRGYSYIGEENTPSNNNRDILAIRNSFKIFSKTKVFLEYAHGWLDYFKDKDSSLNYDRYWIGLDGTFLRKLSGEVKYGYVASNPKIGKHQHGSNMSMKLNYKPSRRLGFYTEVFKGFGDSGLMNDTINKTRGVRLGASYLPLSNRRLRLQTSVSYKEQDLDPDLRNKYFTFNFIPEYKLTKWLSAGLNYQYSERKSSDKLIEYIDNSVALTLNSEF
ncbi:MAG: outer membrane beta-barrel protein [Candidatus Omnitrophota bacterium]|nr:outer membrane beta-barrel protein [Candidatus Omnitrophota bacterium]